MPQTNRWYSWAVHTKATYRYGLLFLVWAIFIIGWRYGIHAWLDAAITTEQTTIAQLQKQVIQLTRAERINRELQDTLPFLRKQLQSYYPANERLWQQQQCNYVVDEAQRAGLEIVSYSDEKEKKKPWGLYQSVQLSMSGTFEQLCSFFNTIKQSHYMIQCNQMHASRTEGDTFSASCCLKLMMAGD